MINVPIDNVIAIPTLVGSVLSFLGAATAIVLHFSFPPKLHVRHALIINLLIADLINSLNNTISGSLILSKGFNSSASDACVANGWVGQFSVQAVDFNILIISIAVLRTALSSRLVTELSRKTIALICVAVWVPGFITSNIGLALKLYGPVSGNWCWIRPEYLGLRYALTHGWRIAIFVATIAIYSYIYVHLKRVFGKLWVSEDAFMSTTGSNPVNRGATELIMSDSQDILVVESVSVSHELNDLQTRPSHLSDNLPEDHIPSWSDSSTLGLRSTAIHGRQAPGNDRRLTRTETRVSSHVPAPPNLKRMLLLNGYPIAYIILWIPGMANRIAESVGTSPRWLRALQASTQFVGLTNSLTYGINEQLQRRILQHMRE